MPTCFAPHLPQLFPIPHTHVKFLLFHTHIKCTTEAVGQPLAPPMVMPCFCLLLLKGFLQPPNTMSPGVCPTFDAFNQYPQLWLRQGTRPLQ